MGRLNAIGSWFEKLADGWVFGTQLYKLIFRKNAEIIGTDDMLHTYQFQEKSGTVAHLDDIPNLNAIFVTATEYSTIKFDRLGGYIYGSPELPLSNVQLFLDLTTGLVQFSQVMIYHQSDSVPTFDGLDTPNNVKILGSYITSVVNRIAVFHEGNGNIIIGFLNDAVGIQDGLVTSGITTIPTEITANISGFSWRIAGDLFSSGTLTGIAINPLPATYDVVDLLVGDSNGDVIYVPGEESENQPTPQIPINTILLTTLYRNLSGTVVEIPGVDLTDYVRKSVTGNQTIQSNLSIAPLAGNLGKVASFDANGKLIAIDLPKYVNGEKLYFSLTIQDQFTGIVDASWIGYNGVTRTVENVEVNFIGLPSAGNFRYDLIQGLDNGTLFVKTGSQGVELAVAPPIDDFDKVSLGMILWSHTGEYQITESSSNSSFIVSNKRYRTRVAPNTTGKYAKVCDFDLTLNNNYQVQIAFGNPVNPVTVAGSMDNLLLTFTCNPDATITGGTVQIETIGQYADEGEFVLVEVAVGKAELYHKANHYWSRLQYVFPFYNSTVYDRNFFDDQPYGALPAGNNWLSIKGISGGSKWTDLGSDIYRDSKVLIGGATFLDVNAKLEVYGRVSQVGMSTSTHFGFEAGLNDNFSDNRSTSFGYRVLKISITGYANSAFGYNSLTANTTGQFNDAFGADSLKANTTGEVNSAFGTASLQANISGIWNTAMGFCALYTNNGSYNVAIGSQAALLQALASYNTIIGARAFENNLTGSNNVGIGYYVAQANSSISNSIIIGYNSRPASNGQINQIVIGYNAVGNGSNSVTIGNSSITKNWLFGTLKIGGLAVADGAVTSVGLDSQGNFVPASGSPTNETISTPTTASLNMATEVSLKRYLLQANLVINFSVNPTSTFSYDKTFVFKQDAIGGRTVTWNTIGTAVIWQGGETPLIAPGINEITVITIIWTGQEYLGQKSCGFNV